MGTVKNFEATVLQAAESEFLRDFADTPILAIPGHLLGTSWAGRDLSAVEVRDLLLQRGLIADKDTAWRYLVERSRTAGGAWTVVAVGMAAPMLKSLAKKTADKHPSMRQDDVAAEVLTGFLEHLAVMDLDKDGICVRLYYATMRAAVKAAHRDAALPSIRIEPGSMVPGVPCAHPDVVLARAQRAEVITASEADLIGMTRLDEVSLAEAAECLGVTANAAKIRRQKAEARLAAFLIDQPVPARKDLKHARTRAAA